MFNLLKQKKDTAKKMIKDREDFHRREKKMAEESKGIKRGMPAEYYKNISWSNH